MAKTETVSVRLRQEVLDACGKIANDMATTRSMFMTTVIEKVCDEMLKRMNNGKSNK